MSIGKKESAASVTRSQIARQTTLLAYRTLLKAVVKIDRSPHAVRDYGGDLILLCLNRFEASLRKQFSTMRKARGLRGVLRASFDGTLLLQQGQLTDRLDVAIEAIPIAERIAKVAEELESGKLKVSEWSSLDKALVKVGAYFPGMEAEDPQRGLEKMWEMAEGGDADAQFKVACFLLDGSTSDELSEPLAHMLGEGANGGDRLSADEQASAGDSTLKSTAIEFLVNASQAGHVGAQSRLQSMHAKGETDGLVAEGTDEQGYAEVVRRAETGDAASMTQYGMMLMRGDYVAKDSAKAFQLFTDAVEQGDTYALLCLGGMYRDGNGIEQDLEKAVELFERAQMHDRADVNMRSTAALCVGEALGLQAARLQVGYECPVDAERALGLYQRAAALGNATAQATLGVMYYQGEGVAKDAAKALRLLHAAVEQDEPQALFALGFLAFTGEGQVNPDPMRAFKLFERLIAHADVDPDLKQNAEQMLTILRPMLGMPAAPPQPTILTEAGKAPKQFARIMPAPPAGVGHLH